MRTRTLGKRTSGQQPLRKIIENLNSMTSVSPWLPLAKMAFFRHVNEAPLHGVHGVVWDGVNGSSVGKRMDDIIISLAFIGL